MTAELHAFQPEEVMSYLDGEVTGERALALADHLEHCAECSSLANDFCSLSQHLIAWRFESCPLMERVVEHVVETVTMDNSYGTPAFGRDALAAAMPAELAVPDAQKATTSSSFLHFNWRARVQRPWVWALASTCAMMLVVSTLSFRMLKSGLPKSVIAIDESQVKTQKVVSQLGIPLDRTPAPASGPNGTGNKARGNPRSTNDSRAADESMKRQNSYVAKSDISSSVENRSIDSLPISGRSYMSFPLTDSRSGRDIAPSIGAATGLAGENTRPMIERSASLSLVVKEMGTARPVLEDIARRHHGYFAELNAAEQSGAGRSLSATLRVPVGDLDDTLVELRNLGHVEEEEQGGEEVSQQHLDLEARLQNARNTEKRLTDLLIKRADKLKDILDVERELSNTREAIERMEAQKRTMENQVKYASVDLKLCEEYKPTLNLAPPATGARLRNAMVDGYRAALENALGLVLFLFANGPSILFWLLILFFPARWAWRKFRLATVPKQSLAGAL